MCVRNLPSDLCSVTDRARNGPHMWSKHCTVTRSYRPPVNPKEAVLSAALLLSPSSTVFRFSINARNAPLVSEMSNRDYTFGMK